MPQFYLTNKAKEDLMDIGRYTTSEWGVEQRNIYLKKIDNAFHDLANKPDKGRNCDDIRQGYHKQSVGKHLVFYRLVEDNNIEIVRVLHGRMDIESHLLKN